MQRISSPFDNLSSHMSQIGPILYILIMLNGMSHCQRINELSLLLNVPLMSRLEKFHSKVRRVIDFCESLNHDVLLLKESNYWIESDTILTHLCFVDSYLDNSQETLENRGQLLNLCSEYGLRAMNTSCDKFPIKHATWVHATTKTESMMNLVLDTRSARLIYTNLRASPLADVNSDNLLLKVNFRVRQSLTFGHSFFRKKSAQKNQAAYATSVTGHTSRVRDHSFLVRVVQDVVTDIKS